MKKQKLTIFTCFHKRADLSAMWLNNMAGLQKHFEKSMELRIVVAVTEGDAESIALCERHAKFPLTYMECPNNPVGLKWNFALSMAMQTEADYYCKADDDGILTRDGMSKMLSMMASAHPYIGFRGEAFVDAHNREASYFRYPSAAKCMGTFKAFNAELIESVVLWVKVEHLQKLSLDYRIHEQGEQSWMPARLAGYFVEQGIVQAVTDKNDRIVTRINLWERWERNLDWCSDARLAMQGVFCKTIDSDTPLLLNVKLPGKNIWGFDHRGPEGDKYPFADLKKHLTGSDWHALNQLNPPTPAAMSAV